MASRPPLVKPSGRKAPARSASTVTAYQRDPQVKAWVLARSEGKCECCKEAAPFRTPDGMPYLEVHHLRMLADAGSDRVSNAVALCPNCHRRFHYGVGVHELKAWIFSEIDELKPE